MSKKKEDELEKEREVFISGAVSNGVSLEVATELFNEMESFAKYAFNKSHAAAYAFISYRTAYLKANYPNAIIFATGDFNNHAGTWYDIYKTATHLIDSREAAEAKGTLVNRLPGIPEQIYIDHAFTNLPAEAVTRWETIDHPYAKHLSDHRTQYGDYCIR